MNDIKPRYRQVLRDALKCRCPNCHRGKIFQGRLNHVLPRCSECGLLFMRESGYFVGGMIITYVSTSFLIVGLFLISLLLPDVATSIGAKIAGWMALAIVFALILVRPAYSLWLGLDFWIDPWKPGGARRS